MEENKNYYFFKEEDLFSVLNFAKNYQLNETKQSRGRTNQGVRNFGGLLDAFLPGKLIEIAVCRILERYSKDKKFYPDFEIYSNKEVGEKSDPDITKIKENDINRKPNIFIEIKKTELNDRWLGPRKDQIKDMTNGFMIHASIKFDDSLKSKNQDVVASMLKKIISPDFLDLKDFSNFTDLIAKIEYAYSFRDLWDRGHFFESGNIIPETEFPKSADAYTKKGLLRKGYKQIDVYNGFNKLKMKWKNKYSSFSDWKIEGHFEILEDGYGKEHIYAFEETKMFSEVFGNFIIRAGDTHRFYFKNTLGERGGKDEFKTRDDYWFSKRRFDEMIISKDVDNLDAILYRIASGL